MAMVEQVSPVMSETEPHIRMRNEDPRIRIKAADRSEKMTDKGGGTPAATGTSPGESVLGGGTTALEFFRRAEFFIF
jgi:hypothetical protein